MKLIPKYLITLGLISACISCDSQIESTEIVGRWKVASVERIKDGDVAPDYKSYFTFRSDSTLISENDLIGEHESTWTMFGNEIQMIDNQDTTIMRIDDFTNTKMVLISDLGKDDLKFTLIKEERH